MIGLKGPCTIYSLRREFMRSPSQYWSASSGAVYPLVLRLKKRGLVRVTSKTRDGRKGSLYALTDAGSKALAEWIGGLDSAASISVPPDPLRNRIAFFGLLGLRDQRTLLARAIAQAKAYLVQVKAYTACEHASGGTFEYLVSAGAQKMLESRLEWLQSLSRALGGP
jgi:DNA-binding PadR family transcriptional regulator